MMTRQFDQNLNRGIFIAMLIMAIACILFMPNIQAKALCGVLFGCGALMSLAISSRGWAKPLFALSMITFVICVLYASTFN